MRWLDEGFREDPGHYFLQTLLALVVLGCIAWVMLPLAPAQVVTASLGASAFIVFAMPKHDTARTRNVVGGQAVGIGIGLLFSALVDYSALSRLPQAAFLAGVVAVAIFVMVLTNTEHPPAAGNALAFAIMPIHGRAALAAFGVVVALAAARLLLRDWLRDLV